MTRRRFLVTAASASVLAVGSVWFARAFLAAREAARAAQCVGDLQLIGLALLNYESEHGTLPPAFTIDAEGRPLLSWRVVILPYMEQHELYERFRLDQPWNGPDNVKLLDAMPRGFACATRQPNAGRGGVPTRFANYLAAAGPGTAFPGSAPVAFADYTDGRDQTIILVESDQADVPWTAPIDLDVRTGGLVNDPASTARGPTTPHPSSLLVVTAEDAVLRLDPEKLRRALASVATIAGGEKVRLEDLRPTPR